MTTRENESRAQYAYRILRKKISEGEIGLGEKLVETDIANTLDLSRTPVREALKRLETEGFLHSENNRSLVVATISVAKANELYYMREAIEGMNARLAAAYATQQDITDMANLLEREAGVPKGDAKLILEINDQYHLAISKASKNRYLLNALYLYQSSMEVLRISTKPMFVPAEAAHEQHVRIFNAIEQGNTADAELFAREHIRSSRRKRIALLKALDESKS